MYLFAFLGVDLKFAVPFGHIFTSITTAFNRQPLHRFVLYLQEHLNFHFLVLFFHLRQVKFSPDQVPCVKPGKINRLKPILLTEIPSSAAQRDCSDEKEMLCFGISFTVANALQPNVSPCEIVAAIPAFVGASTIPVTRFQTAFVHADMDEGGFSLAASPTKYLIHNAVHMLSFVFLKVKIQRIH